MMRRGGAILLCAALVASSTAQAADTRLSADVNAGVGWSSNPYAEGSGESGSGFYELGIQPHLSVTTGRSTVTLNGRARMQDYFTGYSATNSYGADLGDTTQVNERLSVNARLSYDSSIVGTAGGYDSGLSSGLPLAGEDLGLFGSGDRREVYSASAGASYILSARDSVNVSAFYTISRYDGLSNVGDYNSYGGTLGYQRQVRQHLKLGIQGSIVSSDYRNTAWSSRSYSVQGTFDAQLSQHWNLNGALGASFWDRGLGGGASVSPSGNVSLCHHGERDQECLTASRQIMPTGFGGNQNQTNILLTGNYTLGPRTSLNGSLGYTDISRDQIVGVPYINGYVRGEVGIRRKLTRRLSLTSSAFYRIFNGSDMNARSDYGGRIGISYRIGDVR